MRIGVVILGTVSQLVPNPRLLLRNCIKGTTTDRQNRDVIKWVLTGKQWTEPPQIEDLIATLGVVLCALKPRSSRLEADQVFKVILCYTEISKLAWAT